MRPAREPESTRPKPCVPLKKRRRNLARSPLLVGPRRKKIDRGQRSAFPSETSRFTPLILAHRGSALPWLVDDRAALRPRRIWCLLALESVPRYACACCCALPGFPRQCSSPASRVPPPPKGLPNWSSEEAHLVNTILNEPKPPPRLNRPAESQREPVGLHLLMVGPILHPPERPSHTYTPKPGFGGRGQESAAKAAELLHEMSVDMKDK